MEPGEPVLTATERRKVAPSSFSPCELSRHMRLARSFIRDSIRGFGAKRAMSSSSSSPRILTAGLGGGLDVVNASLLWFALRHDKYVDQLCVAPVQRF
jgi:hypothetical protein